ncbi:hypothetical protein B5807_06800 [Epicoccum nigrum]|uniref:Uncharacterized protein n=1 Tax=Epicoccum nigrum TaxID=105696 RepID=A0A1Y2LYD7_EPING|nr:hypothetical protein B5807_06800 [Epicoccum nigrum]
MDSDFDIVDGVWRTAPTCCPPPRLIKNNPIPPEAFAMPPWNIRPPSLRSTGDEQTHVEPEIVANTISSDNNPARSSQSTHQEPPLVFENDDVSGPNDNPGPFPPQYPDLTTPAIFIPDDVPNINPIKQEVSDGPEQGVNDGPVHDALVAAGYQFIRKGGVVEDPTLDHEEWPYNSENGYTGPDQTAYDRKVANVHIATGPKIQETGHTYGLE